MTTEPDYPTEEMLRPQQQLLVDILSDLKEHTVEDICSNEHFAGFKRGTIHELMRILREKGYEISSPEKKMTRPYTFRLESTSRGDPRSQERCKCCGQKFRRIETLRGVNLSSNDNTPSVQAKAA